MATTDGTTDGAHAGVMSSQRKPLYLPNQCAHHCLLVQCADKKIVGPLPCRCDVNTIRLADNNEISDAKYTIISDDNHRFSGVSYMFPAAGLHAQSRNMVHVDMYVITATAERNQNHREHRGRCSTLR